MGLSNQNLRDHAAALEKTLGDVADDIVSRVDKTERRDRKKESKQEENSCHNTSNSNTSENANELPLTEMANLHTETREDQLSPSANTLTEEERELGEKSAQLFAQVHTREVDYSNRDIDTLTKQKPTQRDLKSIDNVISSLMEQNMECAEEHLIAYLWGPNCVFYSVVVAFMLLKGWKRESKDRTESRDKGDKCRRNIWRMLVK